MRVIIPGPKDRPTYNTDLTPIENLEALLDSGEISKSIARHVREEMTRTGETPHDAITRLGLWFC